MSHLKTMNYEVHETKVANLTMIVKQIHKTKRSEM